jgi:hypothetical protein
MKINWLLVPVVLGVYWVASEVCRTMDKLVEHWRNTHRLERFKG